MAKDVFQKFYTSLAAHFNAFIKGIYISLPDGVSSQQVKSDICWHFADSFREIITYDPYHGLTKIQIGKEDPRRRTKKSSGGERIDFLTLLDRIAYQIRHSKHRLLVLIDGGDAYLNEDLVALKLAEILGRKSFGYSLSFIGFKEFPRFNPLTRLNIHEVVYPSPCKASLKSLVRSGLEAVRVEGESSIDPDALEDKLADSLFGCPSVAVAEDIFNLAYSTDGGFNPVLVEKLKVSKVISYIPGITIQSPFDLPSMDQVAGLAHLKSYCETRKSIFLRATGEIRLHGICLLGPPGTGKTLFSQALAHEWEVPYCSLSMTFLSRFVGSSERNLEKILRMLTDFGKPILFHIDEVSRLFGVASAELHEVTRRIVAILLSFLEAPESKHIYTVGTMNSLELDPALLRRFDDVFYVGLPDGSSRKELFECFSKRHAIDLPLDGSVGNLSRGMVGSEIERTVKDLKIESLSRGTGPSSLDLMRVLKNKPALATLFPSIQEIEELALRAGFRLASYRREEVSDLEFRRSR